MKCSPEFAGATTSHCEDNDADDNEYGTEYHARDQAALTIHFDGESVTVTTETIHETPDTLHISRYDMHNTIFP